MSNQIIKRKECSKYMFLFTHSFCQPETVSEVKYILYDTYVINGSWVIWNRSSKPQIEHLQMQYPDHTLHNSILFYLKTRLYAFSGHPDSLEGIYL